MHAGCFYPHFLSYCPLIYKAPVFYFGMFYSLVFVHTSITALSLYSSQSSVFNPSRNAVASGGLIAN